MMHGRVTEPPSVRVFDSSGRRLADTTQDNAIKLAEKGKGTWVFSGGRACIRLTYCPPATLLDEPVEQKRGKSAKRRRARIKTLLKRDGDTCFYCLEAMLPEDITIEHLLAWKHFPSFNQANLVLAHEKCNHAAGHLHIMQKIRIREWALARSLAAEAHVTSEAEATS